MSAGAGAVSSIAVNGTTIELVDRGHGRPIFFLHPGIGIDFDAPVLKALERGGRVIGTSQLPKGMNTVDDVSYFYLDLLEQLDLDDVLLVGVGLGGWIAAEIAVKNATRLAALVMGNPIGVKIGDRETRDIVDIWSIMPDEFNKLAYHDPKNGERDYKNLPEAASLAAARNREAYARLAWSPYMHNPKLKSRLHRISVPTLFLWGTADRILSESYGRGYGALVPNARFETIEHAGHFPHIEQPDDFARRALGFADAQQPAVQRSRRA